MTLSAAVHSTIDWDRQGKQVGYIQLPVSGNQSAWGHVRVPIVCVVNGSGPSILVLAGTHGDEYEGQVAARKLALNVDPGAIQGRIMIIPCLSVQSSRAATRLWPEGIDLNRCYPGRPDGTTPDQLAYFVTSVLVPMSDIVCDIHSGGRSLLFHPMMNINLVPDRALRKTTLDAMTAWNADYCVVYVNISGPGLIEPEVQRQGKIMVATELGGGGYATARTIEIAEHGLWNLLRYAGVLQEPIVTRESIGLPETVILRAMDPGDYVLAPSDGVYEPFVDPGGHVSAGQPLGQLHSMVDARHSPIVVAARTDGVVCSIRGIGSTQIGDCLAMVGQPCDRRDIETEVAP